MRFYSADFLKDIVGVLISNEQVESHGGEGKKKKKTLSKMEIRRKKPWEELWNSASRSHAPHILLESFSESFKKLFYIEFKWIVS